MQCSVCGSQDVSPKSGISKKSGKPWKAYDCNEPQCKNEKGYASRTFVFMKNSPPQPSNAKLGASGGSVNNPISTLEKKVDKILAILKANFPEVEISTETTELVNDETPF